MTEQAKIIPRLQFNAGIVHPTLTTQWVSSRRWGEIATELEVFYKDVIPMKPSRKTFSRLIIGTLTVVNAGTEDEEVVGLLNQPEAAKVNYLEKVERLKSRYAAS